MAPSSTSPPCPISPTSTPATTPSPAPSPPISAAAPPPPSASSTSPRTASPAPSPIAAQPIAAALSESSISAPTPSQKLSLSANNFVGDISVNLSSLSNLRVLDLSLNSFGGSIPDAFRNLSMLEQFVAHSNSFTGELPPSLSHCSMLKVLDLRNNSLTGSIDLDFSNMPFLRTLDLASNHFVGPLPVNLSNCQELQTFSVAKNSLSGEIPEEYKTLVSLSLLSLSNNSFHNMSGALNVLQGCTKLNTLILTKNFHGEEIPELSDGFANLEVLALGNCDLKGQIPLWLSKCEKLQVLDLSWNRLSGSIPPWIDQLEYLTYLDISNNSLSGEIPKSLTHLKSLVFAQTYPSSNSIGMPLYVKRNKTTCGLQYNQLSSFPPSLYLNDNRFNGTIWPEFGHLKALHVLDLSKNNLSGSIPETLSEMENLEVLDLSWNQLNGSIPKSLSKLTFLSKFSVAHNNLEGEIPSGDQFFTFSNSSFEGNPGLCRSSMPCNGSQSVVGFKPEISTNMGNRIGRSSILGITISIGVGAALLLAVVLLNMSRKDIVDPMAEEDLEGGPHRSSDSSSKLVFFFPNSDTKDLTIGDLLKSTNNFDQANIIGCGGFGLVYKAYLPDGSKAAIKRLSGDCGQMEREFHAEVEALSRAQHKNLVSLKGYCKYGNDRLLIYSYMENGSLDYCYTKEPMRSLLKWEMRLRIAQGSARGLAYLHKICEPNIIHRDVKSSNILLDEKFEAHLADFGLSRLIRPYDTHVTTDLVGTLGYIPPEYSQSLIATPRGDVFSFGVVLLELLTGRRPVDVCKAKGCRDLVSWVIRMKAEKKEEQIFDSVIWSKVHEKQLLMVLETACKCISSDPRHRPSIDQVVLWLDGVGSDAQSC
ncbi:Phytosulfokine receptor 2 [Ananas comosus]|uniref:non-specific serine/threonine protein kinase n=1 Tax=Ananas comosus TaxID=4615 RepID=A0A199UN76_ANACO|nr:Phytosulfokine receptor 2 [Ananas comosus]